MHLKIPFDLVQVCGAGCVIEEGEEECHNKVTYGEEEVTHSKEECHSKVIHSEEGTTKRQHKDRKSKVRNGKQSVTIRQ